MRPTAAPLDPGPQRGPAAAGDGGIRGITSASGSRCRLFQHAALGTRRGQEPGAGCGINGPSPKGPLHLFLACALGGSAGSGRLRGIARTRTRTGHRRPTFAPEDHQHTGTLSRVPPAGRGQKRWPAAAHS